MAITKRSDKGSALTYNEMDDNFDAIAPRTSATGAIEIPAGTTSDRPSNPDAGMFRYNTSLNSFEGYSSGAWGAIAGGGGGGGDVNQNAWSEFVVSGQATVAADNATDSITLIAGSNMSITTDAGADSITFNATFNQDFRYSSLTGAPAIPGDLTDLGITDGSSGQVLSTDGSGNFTFVNQTGGGTQGVQGITGLQGPLGTTLQGVQGPIGPSGADGADGVDGNPGIQGPAGSMQGTQGVQGGLGFQGTTGSSIQGIQGPAAQAQGTQGPEGPAGDFGPQGIQGIQGGGGQGVQGVQGSRGFDGQPGFQGIQGGGGQGAQGIQGDTGPAGFGAQGFQGTQGLIGPGGTGPQGIQGLQGPQGMQGFQGTEGGDGPNGPQGIQGPAGSVQGIQGITGVGDKGAQGIQGTSIQGVTGADGAQGAQGTQGDLGIQGTQGTKGESGLQGVQGIQGLQGSVGVQGILGAGTQGVQGIQGTKGDQGNPGAQGVTGVGAQGARGIQGTTLQGLQGPNGVGVQGFQGTQGVQSVQGPRGIQGPSNGLQGIQGPSGPTGPSGGIDGVDGAQGVQGIKGDFVQGLQGQTGPAGIQGPFGIQGVQGPSSLQGIQGPSGTTGNLNNVVEDTTPQLGGNLDARNNIILNVNYVQTGQVTSGNASDLIIQPSTGNSLQIGHASVTEKVLIQAGGGKTLGDVANNEVYLGGTVTINDITFPTADGTSGQALTTNGSGQLVFTAVGTLSNLVEDTSPQLGGTLDAANNGVTDLSSINGMSFPQTDGTAGQVLQTDGANNITWSTISAGLSNVVEDTTPQLGGNLDLNGSIITDSTATTPGHFKIYDVAGQGTAVEIKGGSGSAGGVSIIPNGVNEYGLIVKDSSSNIVLSTYGNQISINGLAYPTADGTVGQVLTTNGSGTLSFTTPSGGISNVVEDTTPQLGGELYAGYDINIHAADGTQVADLGANGNTQFYITTSTYGTDLILNGRNVNIISSGNTEIGNSLAVDNINIGNQSAAANRPVNIWGTTTFFNITTEKTNALTGATGVVVHNLNNGAVFDHASLAANFTANFTNVPTTNSRTISVALILTQGGTAYMPTAVQIDGTAQTILWQGGSAPTGTANGTDVVSFTLIRSSAGAWKVIGSATSYS